MPEAHASEMIKVFIVEDSPIVRDRLIVMLSEVDNVEIIGAASGASEALEAIQHNQPDAIIVDLHLPEGSGFEVLNSVKTNEAQPVLIVLTNYPFKQYRDLSLRGGANYFFDKSSEFEQAVSVVAQLASESPD